MAANATAVWRVRPSGSNTNGGGYDAGIASAGTDWSQANSAHASNIGTVSTATVTLTDTGASFTAADLIGNGIYISGTGISTTFTFITAVPTSTTLTLQTSPGTTGTSVTYHIGGGWADFFTNTTGAPVVPGNIIYILGSGTPNPASYTYDYTSTTNFTPVNGNSTAGEVTFANDPLTPGYKAAPDTTGGMPCIKAAGACFYNCNNLILNGLWFVCSSATNGSLGIINGSYTTAVGCVLDQFAYDVSLYATFGGIMSAFGCEIFTSVAPGASGSNPVLNSVYGGVFIGCNVHNTVGPGAYLTNSGGGSTMINCIVAKCRGYGVKTLSSSGNPITMMNNIIDANAGNGVEIATQQQLATITMLNNIISNHVTAATYGLTVDAGTTAANNQVKLFVDYNTFYNNTADLNAISYGAHDTHGGSNPYVGQATENYTLA